MKRLLLKMVRMREYRLLISSSESKTGILMKAASLAAWVHRDNRLRDSLVVGSATLSRMRVTEALKRRQN